MHGGRFFNSHRTLLVVGFARDRIKGALGNLIRVALDKMKREEDLARRNNLGNAQFDLADPPARGDHIDAIVRAQARVSASTGFISSHARGDMR